MKEKIRGKDGLLQKATSELKAYWRGEVIQREDLKELFQYNTFLGAKR